MMTIELPPVDPRLHAHNKGHWRGKAAATKHLRELAHGLTLQWFGEIGRRESWPAAIIGYRFVVPDLLDRDEANMIQSQKPAVDGVVDSGLIPGDDWKHLHIQAIEVLVGRPRVELRFAPTNPRGGVV